MLVKSGRHLRQHFVAYLALFVALGGSSFAAANALVPSNSVGTKQVIDGSLLKKDFKLGQLPRGARGLRDLRASPDRKAYRDQLGLKARKGRPVS